MQIKFYLDQISEVAKKILNEAKGQKIFVFYGEMGAGKTTLIKAICKNLGVTQNMSSPTFSLVNEYQNTQGQTLYHFDFYRLNSEEEAFDYGYEEYFFSGDYCFIEWPEKIPNLLPANHVAIKISIQNSQREILVSVVP